MEIIGLSGYARSGKDEAAKVLVEEFGFKRVAFADKLRECLYQLNPLVDIKRADVPVSVKTAKGLKKLMFDDETPSTIPVSMPVYLQAVIDMYGWDGYKETEYGDEIRRLAQRMGTEVGRQTISDSIWVDMALTGHRNDAKIVVTDCRFPNEATAIENANGVVWRISRPGVTAVNAHESETALDQWNFDKFISNNGSLEELRNAVARAATVDKQAMIFSRPLEIEVDA